MTLKEFTGICPECGKLGRHNEKTPVARITRNFFCCPNCGKLSVIIEKGARFKVRTTIYEILGTG